MKKRILSIIIAICLLLSCAPITAFAADTYDVFIGDVGFKVGESNVTRKPSGGGSATLVRGTQSTLTLDNINISFDEVSQSAIQTEISNLTIIFKGTNTITLNNDSMCGIYLLSNATLKGNSGSKLIINANGDKIDGINSESDVDVTLDNLNMQVNFRSTSDNVYGIRYGGNLNMKNSCSVKINGTVNPVDGDSFGCLGKYSGKDINIASGAIVTIDGWETAIDTIGDVNLSGGSLTVSNSYDGIYHEGTLNLTGGTLVVEGSRVGILSGPNAQVKFAGTNATVKGGTTGWGFTNSTASYSITGGKVVFEGSSYAAGAKYSSLASGYSVYAGSDKDNVNYIASPVSSTFLNNKYVKIEPSTYYTLTLVNVKGATSASHIYGSDISYTAADAPNEQHFAYWEMQVNGGTPVKVGTSATYKGKMPSANATLTAVYEDCYGGTATCQKLAICSVCGKEHGILALHSFTAEVVDDKYAITPVTCDGAGTYYKSCPVCGASSKNWNNATFTVSAHGHSYTKKVTSSDYLKTAAANCTQKNIYWYVCSYCNACAKDDPAASDKYYTGTTVGPHIYTEKIEDSAHYVAGSGANCQSAKQYYYDCAYCNQIGTSKWNSTTYGPHNYETVWSSNEAGHWHSCSLCDSKADEATHTPDRTAATETEPIKCTVCDYLIAPTIEHTHKLTLVAANPPTCTENGNIAYYMCSVCGKMFKYADGSVELTAEDIVDAAKDHNYEWVVDKQPTETEKGSKHEECTVCHDKKASVEIPPLGPQTEQLQNLLNAGGTVVLDKDYTINQTMVVKKSVTLDLNGHVIKMVGSGSVISVSWSNLTLQDSNKTATHTDTSLPAGGVITGGSAVRGGGVYIGINGSMTMTGGTIANCSAEYGGGVNIYAGSMTMTGGTIANCNATTSDFTYGGGGVYVSQNYTFTMTGGTIENCSAASTTGGGVFSNGDFSMRGNAIIRNCSAKYGGGVNIYAGSMTMTGGTIETCTATTNGKNDAVNVYPNASLLANGGMIKDTVAFSQKSAINTTSTDSYTKFYNEVTNYGTISGGVYYGGIQNKSSGTVSGTYHTVTFDTNGGSSVPTQWFVNTDKAPALQPADPTRDGYQAFDGWYNGDTKYDFTEPVTQSITLTAKYKDAITYTISYDLDGGTADNTTSYTVESDAITLNNPTKTGYTFTGWSGTGLTGENNMVVTIPTGSTNDRVYTAHWADVEAPTGQISIGTSSWKEFLNNITFDLFFKNTQTVTITATDNGGEAVTIEYLLSDNELTVAQLNSATFNQYNDNFSINPENKYVIYAKLTDKSGNVAYINSEGIVLDKTAPVISGIENGKTYCEAQTVTVTEEYIESVKVNGTAVTLDANNQFTLNPAEGTQTIVVTDKAGNETSVTVTVNDGHSYEWQSENSQYWKKCMYCGHETAKKDIPTFTIDAPDTVCRTQDCEASVTLPDSITDAVLTFEFIGLGGAIDTTVEDGKLYGDVTANGYPDVENSFNLVVYATTPDGFTFTVSKTVQIQNEHAGGVATCIELAICDTCGEPYGALDSTNHNLEKISAKGATVTEFGNTEYWHCLDCDKYFADENGENEIELSDTVTAKLPPEIIDGNGQSVTKGSNQPLTFRSNALFGDFIRFELDGETVDPMNYVVKEGSTIVTLNADYVATLSPGKHTIGIVSQSGTATATFTVNAVAHTDKTTKSPETGNDINAAMLLTLILSCGGVIVITGRFGKRKKHSAK